MGVFSVELRWILWEGKTGDCLGPQELKLQILLKWRQPENLPKGPPFGSCRPVIVVLLWWQKTQKPGGALFHLVFCYELAPSLETSYD